MPIFFGISSAFVFGTLSHTHPILEEVISEFHRLDVHYFLNFILLVQYYFWRIVSSSVLPYQIRFEFIPCFVIVCFPLSCLFCLFFLL
jgi:hypothetical protein